MVKNMPRMSISCSTGDNDHIAKLCKAVVLLSYVLMNESVQGLVEEFGKKHSDNPNFKTVSAYVEIMEILLDFIKHGTPREDGTSDSCRVHS